MEDKSWFVFYALIVEYHSTKRNCFINFIERSYGMIYDTIKDIASKQKVSIRKMEKDLGFSNGTMNRWNEFEPKIGQIVQVAEYLRVPVEQLIFTKRRKNKSKED